MRVVVHEIDPRWGRLPGVEIAVRHLGLAGPDLPEHCLVPIERGIEAGLEHLFGFRRGWAELEDLERADLRDDPDEEGRALFAEGRFQVLLSPVLLVAGARQVVQELLPRRAGGAL